MHLLRSCYSCYSFLIGGLVMSLSWLPFPLNLGFSTVEPSIGATPSTPSNPTSDLKSETKEDNPRSEPIVQVPAPPSSPPQSSKSSPPPPPPPPSTPFERHMPISEVYADVEYANKWVPLSLATFITAAYAITMKWRLYPNGAARIRLNQLLSPEVFALPVTDRWVVEDAIHVFKIDEQLAKKEGYNIQPLYVDCKDYDSFATGAVTGEVKSAPSEEEKYEYRVQLKLLTEVDLVTTTFNPIGERSLVWGKAILSTNGVLLGVFDVQSSGLSFLYVHIEMFHNITLPKNDKLIPVNP